MDRTISIQVRSHVARDLLQSAQVFKKDTQVVWEYVTNSLQYSSLGVSPKVTVEINQPLRSISISDNGRGMDISDLEHFFTMHGENKERKAGEIGRGMFGTGKSAAFGIANSLKIISVKNGRRTAAVLEKKSVESMRSGSDIPVSVLEAEVPTPQQNGTTIVISGISLSKIDRPGIIAYIERRLKPYPPDVEVYVDSHKCSFTEPDVAEIREYSEPTDSRDFIHGIHLLLKVAKAPLDAESKGVQVFSHGNWLSTTLAGSEGKEFSDYIFGEIEMPALEEYSGAIKPYDNTRSGELNPNSEVVQVLFRYLGPKIDDLRRELVQRSREYARSQQAKELAKNASRIAELLNKDFADFQLQLRRSKLVNDGRFANSPSSSLLSGDEDDGSTWAEGGDDLAVPLPQDSLQQDETGRTKEPITQSDVLKQVQQDVDGATTGRPAGGEGKARVSRGGFIVTYKELGKEEPRARYISDGRELLINLDHPQINLAFERSQRNVQTPEFIRTSWEVALSEYSVALARMRDESGQYLAVEEALFDIRDTVNRLSRQFLVD